MTPSPVPSPQSPKGKKQRQARTVRMWGVKSGSIVLPFTIRSTKNRAKIDREEYWRQAGYPWPECDRVVALLVTEAPTR